MSKEREQKLIDILYEIGIKIHEDKWFKDKSREELAEWIRQKLKNCGFNTVLCGISWGVLIDE